MTGLEPLLFGMAAAGSGATATAATAGLIGAGGSFAMIPTIMTAGTVLSAAGAIATSQALKKQGKQAQIDKQFQAAQLEQSGLQDVAASQRVAIERRRQATLKSSRVLALAAASGGGMLDPNVVNTIAGFAEEGELEAQKELYAGKETLRAKQLGATAARYEGYSEMKAGKIAARTTLLKSAGSLLSKYGN